MTKILSLIAVMQIRPFRVPALSPEFVPFAVALFTLSSGSLSFMDLALAVSLLIHWLSPSYLACCLWLLFHIPYLTVFAIYSLPLPTSSCYALL